MYSMDVLYTLLPVQNIHILYNGMWENPNSFKTYQLINQNLHEKWYEFKINIPDMQGFDKTPVSM